LSGDVADVRRLVAAGADLEEQYDVDGWRPLHVAAAMGMLEVVTVLVELGADKEAKEANGWRPLHMAAGNGHVETMTVLVQLGANKEAKG
jgi:ankyrin repeat protein